MVLHFSKNGHLSTRLSVSQYSQVRKPRIPCVFLTSVSWGYRHTYYTLFTLLAEKVAPLGLAISAVIFNKPFILTRFSPLFSPRRLRHQHGMIQLPRDGATASEPPWHFGGCGSSLLCKGWSVLVHKSTIGHVNSDHGPTGKVNEVE